MLGQLDTNKFQHLRDDRSNSAQSWATFPILASSTGHRNYALSAEETHFQSPATYSVLIYSAVGLKVAISQAPEDLF